MKYILPMILALGLLLTACSESRKIVKSDELEEVVADTIYVKATPKEKLEKAPQSLPVYHPSHTRTADLLHTRLHLSFDWEGELVKGKADLSFTPVFYPINEVRLDAVNFLIHGIRSDNAKGPELEYSYDEKDILISLDKTYERGDTFNVHIDYTARPSMGSSENDGAIKSDQGLFFIKPDSDNPEKPRQIWTQGETEFNSRWFPTIDKPNERTTQDITLRVSNSYVTLSNGDMISSEPYGDDMREDRWVQDRPHAPYLFMIAVGDFAVVKKEINGIDISYYVEKEYEPYAGDIFDHTAQMIEFFSDMLDYPFPWDKYAQIVVRDYVSGAMENTSAVIFGDFVQRPKGDLVDNNNDFIVAHELFHHWFGDLVTCESWANLTMNEGFANYSEYLWEEHHNGPDNAELSRLNEIQGYFAEAAEDPHPLIHFGYDNKEDMFDAHSYNKGGLVLHMLRKHLGDELFFAGLKHYLEENKYTAVEAHDLRLAMEDISGQDLNWFFNQWYFGTGHPVLETNYTYSADNQTLNLTIEQVQDPESFEPIFILETPVYVFFKDGSFEERLIRMDRREQSWAWEISREPEWVVVDPHKDLLAQINSKASTDAEFIFQHAVSLNDKIQAMSLMLQQSMPDEAFYERMLQEDFWLFRFLGLNVAGNFGTGPYLYDHICELAISDPNSNVRAMAYSQMRETKMDCDGQSIYRALVADSSYSVIMTGLPVLYQYLPDTAQMLAKSFEKLQGQTITLGLAQFYAMDNMPSSIDYFESNYATIRSGAATSFFEDWQTLVDKIGKDQKIGQYEQWSDITRDVSYSVYQRFGAYIALAGALDSLEASSDKDEQDFSQIKWLKEEIRSLKAGIKNESLLDLIDQFEQP